MDHHYPDGAWLRLRRDVFDRVYRYKRQQGFTGFEQAVASLLDHRLEHAAAMNLERVDDIVRAVLYEGYLLYPYRPSGLKNRQRWTFGGIYPQTYSQSGGGEPCAMQTQC
jgi:hypothetical protein